MKILFVDDKTDGHHASYFNGITNNLNCEYVLLNSNKYDEIQCKQYTCSLWPTQDFKKYIEYIDVIFDIATKENVDIIHFLTMDTFARFWGIGFKKLRRFVLIGTYHKIRLDILHCLSIKIIAQKIDMITCHSDYLGETLTKIGINNYRCIEYPCFHLCKSTQQEARDFFGIQNNLPVIGCIGGTRKDKGLDLLLDAIIGLDTKCNLLISGKAEDFTKEYIEKAVADLNNVTLNLHYLDETELDYSISCSDIIALPYRKIFNGASGPLCEGVHNNKIIVAPDSGNLGYLVKKHHLGYTFICENSNNLHKVLEKAITASFSFDDLYRSYQNMLKPACFSKKYKQLFLDLGTEND